VKAAIRWMKANASGFGIDPGRIIIEGNSAGGHLSLMAAGTPNSPEFEGAGGNPGIDTSVAAAIAFYPPTKLSHWKWGTIPSLFGKDATEETARGGSPITYAKAGHPPTLIFQGNADELVPATEATNMYEALHAAGVPAELHLYAGQPHAFDSDPIFGRQCADIMISFIDRHVRGLRGAS
jgi:acetyl esterase/lipase